MPTSETPQGRDDVVFRQLADDWVLFDPTANRIHVLNLSAALVWNSCTGERSIEQIVTDVSDSYPSQPNRTQVEEDVLKALETFTSEGLLE